MIRTTPPLCRSYLHLEAPNSLETGLQATAWLRKNIFKFKNDFDFAVIETVETSRAVMFRKSNACLCWLVTVADVSCCADLTVVVTGSFACVTLHWGLYFFLPNLPQPLLEKVAIQQPVFRKESWLGVRIPRCTCTQDLHLRAWPVQAFFPPCSQFRGNWLCSAPTGMHEVKEHSYGREEKREAWAQKPNVWPSYASS